MLSQRFTVLEPLGAGGMGTVYEVVDHARQARLALKTLNHRDSEWIARLKHEFRSLQDLHHPNLVSLGELVEEGGRWAFTMERVHGRDFLRYVRQTRLDEGRLRSALTQLALGLNALHQAGKVHRDIKPANILVTDSGRVVLLDFGVLADMGEGSTWGEEVVGSAAYVAPEQMEGEPPSPCADWYSVGVLLYQCLTGVLPFTGRLHEVLRAKRGQQLVPPQERVGGLPEDLCGLCMELLRPEPARRPSGEQVLQRLGAGRAEVDSPPELPFVGRHSERAALHAALAGSREGQPVAVLVVGESGVGKSRLVHQFLQEARVQHPGVLVLSGRCYERESVPYKGVDGLVEGLARYLTALGREAVRALRPAELGTLAGLFPCLRQVPGLIERATGGAAREEPPRVRVVAFAALRELLARLAMQSPVVLAVEDLQWADPDGLALLEELWQSPGVLLVATLRGDGRAPQPPSLSGHPPACLWREARRLELSGLQPPEAHELAGRLLGSELLHEPERAWRIAEESGGQPLFVEALVRHHRAGGGESPLLLEQALWARVQQLEPAARRLLELLTTAGGPLLQAVAAHASSADFAEYLRLAAALRSARLAITSGPSGRDMVELAHDRIRHALALHLLDSTERELHRRLACSLEARGEGDTATLARHWLGAGEVDRAVALYGEAARQAGEALAFSREAALYGVVLGLSLLGPAERCRLQVARAEALVHAGGGVEAAQAFLLAAEDASQEEAHALRQRAAEQYLKCGHVEQGLALVREVLAGVDLRYPESLRGALAVIVRERLALALRPFSLQPRPAEQVPPALRRRMDACWSLGNALAPIDVVRGFGLLSHHLRLALSKGDVPRLLRACTAEALSLAARSPRNRARVARLMARLAPLVARSADEPFLRCYLHFGRMAEPYCVGQVRQARPCLEEALAMLPYLRGESWLEVLLWTLWGELMALQGELGELHRRLAGPVAEARERGDLNGLVGLQVGYPTLGWLARGEPLRARQVADEALARWPAGQWHVQHFKHLQAHSYVDLYEGRGAEVLRRLELHLRAAKRALPITAVRCVSLDLRSRALLMEAGQRRGAEARHLLQAAERDLCRLEREGTAYARVQAALGRAGVALQRGQAEQALAGYTRAAQEAEAQGLRLYAQVARWRQAWLRGGEEGRQCVAALRGQLQAQGLQSPEAWVAMLAPIPQAMPAMPLLPFSLHKR